jgi:hypothetical protein
MVVAAPRASTRPSAASPGCRLGQPGQPHRQQRGQRHGQHHRSGGGHGPEHGGPGQADGQQLAAAETQRPQRAVAQGIGHAEPGQQLPDGEHPDDPEEAGQQPQRHRLQVDRALGVGRLGRERVDARDVPGPSQPGERPLDDGQVRGPGPEAHRGLGEAQHLGPVGPPERRGDPGVRRAGVELRRELGGGGFDAGDAQGDPDRPAAAAVQDHSQPVARVEVPVLGGDERHLGLIGPGRVGGPAGHDLAPPDLPGDPAVLRGHHGEIGRPGPARLSWRT